VFYDYYFVGLQQHVYKIHADGMIIFFSIIIRRYKSLLWSLVLILLLINVVQNFYDAWRLKKNPDNLILTNLPAENKSDLFPDDALNLTNICPLIIFDKNTDSIRKFLNFHREIDFTDEIKLFHELQDCSQWIKIRHYPQKPNSIEEENFPLAFSISLHKNVNQVERLFRSIYWPQNIYCFHVDKKANTTVHSTVER